MQFVSPGRFIALEGMEGAGKTSRLADLRALLESRGIAVLTTREPGGTALGERLRDLLLAPDQAPMTPLTELLLMFAARSEHLQQVILPALEAGQWVLCDRYVDASYAYQGAGRGLGNAPVAALEALLLDLPVELGLARAKNRSASDRFEQESLAFHTRVREAYLRRAAEQPHRYRVIDAAAPPERVRAAVEAAVTDLL
ncbi:MAG TPA: dTMP kinase [Gammaproteobacteria bacterium]|nr:dTMP kinase [Gammaproteobacteria bacterium]MCH78284.1 dTMP kinase [Gammaproteobacteria bacterium]